MSIQLAVQRATQEAVPPENELIDWIGTALDAADKRQSDRAIELCLRAVDIPEMVELNHRFRDQNKETNVLSFPTDPSIEHHHAPAHTLLGDIVVCAPVVRDEAQQQGKEWRAHWAHMVVHGALHLLGYDHVNDGDATVMEALETTILQRLNFPCPYANTTASEQTA